MRSRVPVNTTILPAIGDRRIDDLGAHEIGDRQGRFQAVENLQVMAFAKEADDVVGGRGADTLDADEFLEGIAFVPVLERRPSPSAKRFDEP